ncbi:NHLP leader peptide family RiPP precursor [Nostoc punctiforme]|uniref:Nitrile hydratase-like protein n=1 Tax=Nostoc punctiforme (strain ATCC 29133 / PCC 73102) TaxID=63737 RepID=B2IYS7_NOSP7|nr:NHLP leader peptide family RiPP precursor [Nostoc punctiforme]ACC81660.1 hypothetical protein Npun_R3207 [Nostoc punctiforme PCC 73102]
MSEQEQAQTRQDIEARIIAKAWKDESYKQELLTNSKAVIEREFGVEFPADVTVQVLQENPTSLYFVLPLSPTAIMQELSEEQLQAIAGGGISAVIGNPKLISSALSGLLVSVSYLASHQIRR